MPEVEVRSPDAADAQAIAAACNELSETLCGVADLTAEEICHWLTLPDLDTAVAELGGDVCAYADFRRHDAGICLGEWQASGDRTFGWVRVLGVRKPWRGRGLGLALLRHSSCDFAARGATRVGLGVDAENTTGAVRLYEWAGMRPVRRLNVYERVS